MFSPLEQFDLIPIIFISYKNYEITFFNIFLPLIIIIILYYITYLFKYNLKLVPTGFQVLFENIIEFIFILIKGQIGKKGYIYFPFIFTIFTFILLANLISITPFGIALTSHLIIILWLSLSICSGIFILGLYYKNIVFLKIFIPKCPIILLPVLIIIETFSYIIRAFSLAIRLAANTSAGHTLVDIICLFLINIFFVNFVMFFLGFMGIFAVFLLELGVACLQAYVFTILICIYLNDVFTDEEH